MSFVNVKLESSGVVFKNDSYSNWDILINNVSTTSIAGLLDNSNTNSGKVVFDGNNSIRGTSVLVKGYKDISFLGSTTTEMVSNNTTIQASRADRFNVSSGANVSFKNTNTTGDALVVGNTSRVELNIEKGAVVNVEGNATTSNVYSSPAPFLIDGNGSQVMTITGELNVKSKKWK
ncbi:hypothetical protein AZF37_09595 [endosymbiont 'TC1' of Trimyema compressum]|uniref:hypothetical protein n=1 Tax=endosymbiont 'TC1' of Trimyema compressum TaxID=243899 RepID=UPI0007F114F2|nr:hypothetical protein [endosymbiont 'TC1' of Trimyema compressum]AMP21370.1 hypothetical protein AZF37_09595 [endosymbiont 'TC1' of Trimyema compressum]